MTQHTSPARYPIWLTFAERQLVQAAVRSLMSQQLTPSLTASLRQVLRQYTTLTQFDTTHQRVRACLRLPEDVIPVWLTVEEVAALVNIEQLPSPLRHHLAPPPRIYTESG